MSHKMLIVSVVLIVVGFLVGAVSAVIEAWMDTRKRPREEQYWCSTHGPVRKKHMLPLFPGMVKQNGEPFTICPLCVKTAWEKAESGVK